MTNTDLLLPFVGMAHVSGEPGSGKTNWILGSGAPVATTVLLDADMKSEDVARQIQALKGAFARYEDMTKLCAGMSEIPMFDHWYGIFSEIKQEVARRGQKFDVIAIDNWTAFEDTIFAKTNTIAGRLQTQWAAQGQIKSGQMWKLSFRYETEIMNDLLESCQLLLLTSHVKDHTLKGSRTGKKIPIQKKPIEQKSMLRAYLMVSRMGAEPKAVLLKRPTKYILDARGAVVPINYLPPRMEPFSWERIRYFYEHPVGNGEIPAEYRLDDFEMSIVKETLTTEQYEIWKTPELDDEESRAIVAALPDYKLEDINAVQERLADGKNLPTIAKETGLAIPVIIGIQKLFEGN